MKYLLLRFENYCLVGCDEIEADTDATAAQHAAERYDGGALELWSQCRKIANYEASTRPYRWRPQQVAG